jgi:hypothetical protein
MQRSRPLQIHPMLYGCGCGVVGKSNCLMTSAKIRFFWLPLSTIKCSGVPFTHICEWKRHSPSLYLSSYYGWIVVVTMVAMSYASMIYFLLLFFESNSKSRFISFSLSSPTNDYFERHSSVLCQGIFWKSHHFPMFFCVFSLPFFSCFLD